MTSKKVKRIGKKKPTFKRAVDKEIKYLKEDKDQIMLDQKYQKEETDIEFIIGADDDFEDKNEEIIVKLEREVYKTPSQKLEDYKNIDPNFPMINGGENDVYQAIL